MKIRPTADRVLVKRHEAGDKSKGGIILPDNAKEKPRRGTIVAMGPGRRNDDGTTVPMSIHLNETVLFTPYAGSEVQGMDGYVLLNESDILAVVTEE